MLEIRGWGKVGSGGGAALGEGAGESGEGRGDCGAGRGESYYSRASMLRLVVLGLLVPESGFVGRPAGVIPCFDEETVHVASSSATSFFLAIFSSNVLGKTSDAHMSISFMNLPRAAPFPRSHHASHRRRGRRGENRGPETYLCVVST